MTQSANSRFVEIGRLGKPRGLDGVIRFEPGKLFTVDIFEETELFYIKNVRSDLIPIRIENIHAEEKRNQLTFFVKFDTIASRTDADAAQGKSLFTTNDKINTEDEFKDDSSTSLIGYSVLYDGSPVGQVLDLLENPAHPIIEIKLDSGALLVPYVDEFVEKTDHENHTLVCKNLDQLTDI